MNFKEQFSEEWLPVCKPFPRPHTSDIKLGYLFRSNQYRLYCRICYRRGPALPQKGLSQADKDNADEL